MRSPLTLAFIYILLGIVFTYFAIQHVLQYGWGIFVFFLIFLATVDLGGGIRMVFFYLKNKHIK